MKRLLVIVLTAVAVAFGTASTAQAHDRSCYRSYSSHGHYNSYRSYSSGYCQPRYYNSYNNCQPRYYQSYNCAPRYYSAPRCYGSSFSISIP
ncbi:MAG: hypothetical protein ACAH88_12445, partial [Roseimicrobium sp.]